MPPTSSEAFEDEIELEIGLLDASVPELGAPWPGYPYPQLRVDGGVEKRKFKAVLLENRYLRLTLLPDLGGRIIRLFDKRTTTEILPPVTRITPHEGGRRCVQATKGIRYLLDGQQRLNDLGASAAQIEFAPEEGGESAVWVAETCTGTGVSFHARISLPPDRAEVSVEVRAFNRCLRPTPYNGGLSILLGEGVLEGSFYRCANRNVGIGVFPEVAPMDHLTVEDGCLTVCRFHQVCNLAPRQVDTWKVRLTPFSGLGGLSAGDREVGVYQDQERIRIQSVAERLGHKLLLHDERGQTFEAPVDLYPEHILELPIEGLNPVALAIMNPAKEVVTRVDLAGAEPAPIPARPHRSPIAEMSPDASDDDLRRATFDVSTRHIAHTLLGLKALGNRRYSEADGAFEQALMYNADDPLLWWSKAVALRLAGLDNEAELLNAHYLAPMEPALRAESFLSQPIRPDGEPNNLVAPLAEHPEDLIEVACLLIESGLFDQASRWIDEALRHCDLLMLHYLWAYCYLVGPNLAAEAAEQVRLAGALPLAPPFPYRDVELKALARLAVAFPSDGRLSTLMSLAKSAGQ